MNLTEIFVNKLKIETKVVSIESVFSEAKVKKTQYAPPYQRNYVWDGEKATYFLESILLGTEIAFLYESFITSNFGMFENAPNCVHIQIDVLNDANSFIFEIQVKGPQRLVLSQDQYTPSSRKS